MKVGDTVVHSSAKRYLSGVIVEDREDEVVISKEGFEVAVPRRELDSGTTLVFSLQEDMSKERAIVLLKDKRHHAEREAALVGEGFSNDWMKYAAQRDLKLFDFIISLIQTPVPECDCSNVTDRPHEKARIRVDDEWHDDDCAVEAHHEQG